MYGFEQIHEEIMTDLHEKDGVISRLGKKVSKVLRKGAEAAEKAEETAGKVKRAAVRGTLEKTGLGAARTAVRKVKGIQREFQSIVDSVSGHRDRLIKVAGKLGEVKGKIKDRYQDVEDEKIKNIITQIETMEKSAKKISSALKGAKTTAGKQVKDETEKVVKESLDQIEECLEDVLEDELL
jgi:CHAD domain-containing protein